MKLLLPLKVGDIVRMNYHSRWEMHYRIIHIAEGCTCENYVDRLNNGSKARKREPHLHFTCVCADEPISKSGKYHESKQRYLGGYAYKNGECVDIDGPHAKGTTGWHKEDDGWDKIILVRAASAGISKLTKLKTKPTTTECDDEDED